jgi:hypothetical protein
MGAKTTGACDRLRGLYVGIMWCLRAHSIMYLHTQHTWIVGMLGDVSKVAGIVFCPAKAVGEAIDLNSDPSRSGGMQWCLRVCCIVGAGSCLESHNFGLMSGSTERPCMCCCVYLWAFVRGKDWHPVLFMLPVRTSRMLTEGCSV